jgi:hypothetical protein
MHAIGRRGATADSLEVRRAFHPLGMDRIVLIGKTGLEVVWTGVKGYVVSALLGGRGSKKPNLPDRSPGNGGFPGFSECAKTQGATFAKFKKV